MITSFQLEQLSRKLKTNTTVVAREYLQLLFLQQFYELSGSEKIFFKGGTAIHFLMEGFRFSEDLDFTCETSQVVINGLTFHSVEKMQAIIAGLTVKEKKTLTGKSYLLTLEKGLVDFPIFFRLDFSFREKVLQRRRAIIKTDFPVIFTSFVYYMDGEEILAEKIRAILTRNRGRDLFDFWFLLKKDYKLNEKIIKAKMKYHPKMSFSWRKVLIKVQNYDFSKFKKDIIPFLTLDKRAKIEETFEIIKGELEEKIERNFLRKKLS